MPAHCSFFIPLYKCTMWYVLPTDKRQPRSRECREGDGGRKKTSGKNMFCIQKLKLEYCKHISSMAIHGDYYYDCRLLWRRMQMGTHLVHIRLCHTHLGNELTLRQCGSKFTVRGKGIACNSSNTNHHHFSHKTTAKKYIYTYVQQQWKRICGMRMKKTARP